MSILVRQSRQLLAPRPWEEDLAAVYLGFGLGDPLGEKEGEGRLGPSPSLKT